MSKKLQPEHIRQVLDNSLEQIEPPVLSRLRQAREQALARHDAAAARGASGWAARWHFDTPHYKFRYFAAAAVFAAVLFSGMTYWQHVHEATEVDVAILTDELPIEVYVD
ncbi:MAG: DUF3619 family protein [Gallionellaceae bacterium]|nr:DUF3619 family protein [Gallionellaceae bacterium]